MTGGNVILFALATVGLLWLLDQAAQLLNRGSLALRNWIERRRWRRIHARSSGPPSPEHWNCRCVVSPYVEDDHK